MREAFASLWGSLIAVLQTHVFSIGQTPVTTLGLLRVLLIMAAAAGLSKLVRGALTRLARRWPDVTPASLYTVGRIAHYLLLALGVVAGLSTIGVDFTHLVVLLGALGIGIGFGLQDVVANFVAGLIILFERHLKVGDFIELESGVVGEVREVRMRATRITTNDNVDILVPNSSFITGRVVNWTFDDAFRRIKVRFGVAYGSNKGAVRAAVLDAAQRSSYTLTGIPSRAPQVWLVGFGDSSLDFELVVWLTPAAVKRPSAVQADYLWHIHDALSERGIEIPYPQRDIHVRGFLGLEDERGRTWLARQTAPSTSQSAAAPVEGRHRHGGR